MLGAGDRYRSRALGLLGMILHHVTEADVLREFLTGLFSVNINEERLGTNIEKSMPKV